jgi:hypothetical protein
MSAHDSLCDRTAYKLKKKLVLPLKEAEPELKPEPSLEDNAEDLVHELESEPLEN